MAELQVDVLDKRFLCDRPAVCKRLQIDGQVLDELVRRGLVNIYQFEKQGWYLNTEVSRFASDHSYLRQLRTIKKEVAEQLEAANDAAINKMVADERKRIRQREAEDERRTRPIPIYKKP